MMECGGADPPPSRYALMYYIEQPLLIHCGHAMRERTRRTVTGAEQRSVHVRKIDGIFADAFARAPHTGKAMAHMARVASKEGCRIALVQYQRYSAERSAERIAHKSASKCACTPRVKGTTHHERVNTRDSRRARIKSGINKTRMRHENDLFVHGQHYRNTRDDTNSLVKNFGVCCGSSPKTMSMNGTGQLKKRLGNLGRKIIIPPHPRQTTPSFTTHHHHSTHSAHRKQQHGCTNAA